MPEDANASKVWHQFGAAAIAVALAGAVGCESDPAPEDSCTSPRLFGSPSDSTGLTSEQCGPTCACGGQSWSPPEMTMAKLEELRAFRLSEPIAEVTEDPYAGPAPADPAPGEVCAVLPDATDPGTYGLGTYASANMAEADGAIVTHASACGACSSLHDLAVYGANPDLTGPVRECGILNLTGTQETHIACLMELGFTLPCAQIWYYNTKHTADVCGSVCFRAINDPHHLEDGSLNPCLACDEEMSGRVFKAVAGRTRRNTGLASALCRPCETVQRLEHVYD